MTRSVLLGGLMAMTLFLMEPYGASELPELPEQPEELADEIWETELSDEELEQQLEELIGEMSGISDWSGEAVELQVVDVDLSAGIYDPGRKQMRYQLPDGSGFYCSIPEGMIASQPVVIEAMENVLVTAYCNEKPFPLLSDLYFTAPGSYRIVVQSFQGGSQGNYDVNIYRAEFYFQIVSAVQSQVSVINAPTGFLIDSVQVDGTELPVHNPRVHITGSDGFYDIQYREEDGGPLLFSTTFLRDTKAPFLEFSEAEDRRGYRLGPVKLLPSENDCTITTFYQGNLVQIMNQQLEYSGYYTVQIQDQAGNQRSYSVTIKQNNQELIIYVIIIAVLVTLALGFRMLYLRRHMKVL